jgi:hypothetical protein
MEQGLIILLSTLIIILLTFTIYVILDLFVFNN